jgi:hypothetical protein
MYSHVTQVKDRISNSPSVNQNTSFSTAVELAQINTLKISPITQLKAVSGLETVETALQRIISQSSGSKTDDEEK